MRPDIFPMSQTWKTQMKNIFRCIAVEFVPPKTGKRKVKVVLYEIVLEFEASRNEARHFPYEPDVENTDEKY